MNHIYFYGRLCSIFDYKGVKSVKGVLSFHEVLDIKIAHKSIMFEVFALSDIFLICYVKNLSLLLHFETNRASNIQLMWVTSHNDPHFGFVNLAISLLLLLYVG